MRQQQTQGRPSSSLGPTRPPEAFSRPQLQRLPRSLSCPEATELLSYPDLPAPLTVHCGSIRQTATILSMDKDCLRTGDKATVHFRFIKTPEYLHIDQRLVFREGRTKAVGTITKVWPSRPPCPAAGSTGGHPSPGL